MRLSRPLLQREITDWTSVPRFLYNVPFSALGGFFSLSLSPTLTTQRIQSHMEDEKILQTNQTFVLELCWIFFEAETLRPKPVWPCTWHCPARSELLALACGALVWRDGKGSLSHPIYPPSGAVAIAACDWSTADRRSGRRAGMAARRR